MHHRLISTLSFCLSGLSLAGCPLFGPVFSRDVGDVADAGPVDTLAQMCEGPRKSARGPWWVVNGTRQPSLLPLSAAQQNAVVSIFNQGGCSGSLISDEVVLTAKHCTHGLNAGDITVTFGPDDSAPLAQAGVREIVEHINLDLAMLVLDRSTAGIAQVEPIPVFGGPLSASWIDQRVEAAGYGLTNPGGGSDGRFFVSEPVYDVSSTTLSVNGEGIHGVCFGDSGGPVMGLVDGGSVRVLGALSYGDSSCTGIDTYTRADVARQWIEQTAGPIPPVGPVPCGDTDAVGRCDGDGAYAYYCESAVLQRDDCRSSSQSCGWSNNANGFRCVDASSDPCQGHDRLGACEGNTMLWCATGDLQRFDCSRCSMACAWVDDAIGYDCVEDPCQGVDYLGRCNGNVAEWCNNGQLDSANCDDYGQTCAYVDDQIGYYCQ